MGRGDDQVYFDEEDAQQAKSIAYILDPAAGNPVVPSREAVVVQLQEVVIQGQVDCNKYPKGSLVQMVQNGYNQIALFSPATQGVVVNTGTHGELVTAFSFVVKKSTQVFMNQSDSIVTVSPNFDRNFSRCKVVATKLRLVSDAISVTRAALTGKIAATALADVRGIDAQNFSQMKTLAVTSKDGRDDIPLSDGVVAIMGPDIGDEMVPVDPKYSKHTGKSAVVYFKGIQPGTLTFIGDEAWELSSAVYGSGSPPNAATVANYTYGSHGLFPNVTIRLIAQMLVPDETYIGMPTVNVTVLDVFVSNMETGGNNTQLQYYVSESSHSLGRGILSFLNGQTYGPGYVTFDGAHIVPSAENLSVLSSAPTGRWSYIGSAYYLDDTGLDYGFAFNNLTLDNATATLGGTNFANAWPNTGVLTAALPIQAAYVRTNALTLANGAQTTPPPITNVSLSVEITFAGLYEQGVVGPARMISWKGAAPDTFINIGGASKIQLQATNELAPYLRAAQGASVIGQGPSVAPALGAIFNSPSKVFKRIYDGIEYEDAVTSVMANGLGAITGAALTHGSPAEVAKVMCQAADVAGQSAGLGGIFRKISDFAQQAAPIAKQLAVPISTVAGIVAPEAAPFVSAGLNMLGSSAGRRGRSAATLEGNAAGMLGGNAGGMLSGNAAGILMGNSCGRCPKRPRM